MPASNGRDMLFLALLAVLLVVMYLTLLLKFCGTVVLSDTGGGYGCY